jgi:hypothetical protein
MSLSKVTALLWLVGGKEAELLINILDISVTSFNM